MRKTLDKFFFLWYNIGTKGQGEQTISTPLERKEMLKVTLTTKTVDVNATIASKKAVFTETKETAIVASTKSYNNLVDERNASGTPVSESKTETLFLDKAETEKALAEFVARQVKEEAIRPAVVEHLMQALDGACVFYRPIKRNK